MNYTPKVRRTRRARLFREVTRAIGRSPHQRVCPLPMACAALAIPFLAAWATAAPAQTATDAPMETGSALELPAGTHPTPDPWAILDRARRQPATNAGAGAYVDIYGPLEPWEEGLIARQGYVSASR